jgi:hypothetical protein
MKDSRLSHVLRRAVLLSLTLAMAGSFNAFAGDAPASDVRTVAPYSAFVIRVPANTTFVVAPKSSITITGPVDTLPFVTTVVQDGQLIVGMKQNDMLHAPLTIKLTGPSIKGASLEGTGSINVEHPDRTSLGLQIKGEGSIVATGNASTLSIDVSGSGSVDSNAMVARKADVSVSGNGKVRAQATEEAVVDVSGVGDVHVSGHPQKRLVNHSGVATVTFD